MNTKTKQAEQAEIDRLAAASAAWDAERERLETSIRKQLWGRARSQGWLNAKGKLSGSGHKAALEFIIGVAAGFEAANAPAKKWMLMQAFLCSARGVDERFPPIETGEDDAN